MSSSKETAILVLALSLAGLIYSQVSIPPVFAAGPDGCFADCGGTCHNPLGLTLYDTCCWNVRIDNTRRYQEQCQTCEINTDTGDFEKCGDVFSRGNIAAGTVPPPSAGNAQPPPPPPPPASTLGPPPSTTAEQPPSITTCPDGSTPDAKGNCPNTAIQQVSPPSTQHHHKGSNNNLLGGESTTPTTKKSKNNNNDNSPPAVP